MRRSWVALACCLYSSVALAQAPGEQPPKDQPKPKQKHLGSALLWSWGATAATSIAAFAGDDIDRPVDYAFAGIGTAAFMLGPTAGHWYLGRAVTPGLVIRLSGVAATAAGLAWIDAYGPQNEDAIAPMFLTIMAGGGIWATGAIWDVVTLPREVRRYNARHASRAEMGLVPMTGRSGTGLALAGTF